jgi:23S rRNA pseudouridine1911/1915/1917 synthase
LFSSLKQFKVSKTHIGKRLDKFLIEELEGKSRSSIQTSINSGEILVNNTVVKTGYKLKENDLIIININENLQERIQPEDIYINVVYEDDHLIVINKPAGMVVHPGAGNKSGTLVNALLYHCNKLSMLSGSLRPGIVHRLDKDTSGLLVVAKNDSTHIKLQEQFQTREIQRVYQAIVWGVPFQKKGEIETFISRSRKDRKKMAVSDTRGKEAVTSYKLIKEFQYLSLLELRLNTGRTHQIRVHLNHLNMPVFGDPVYNGRKSQLRRLPSHLQKRGEALLKKINRQSLHAKELSFIHPKNNEKMNFITDLPEDMNQILNKIEDVLLLKEVRNN